MAIICDGVKPRAAKRRGARVTENGMTSAPKQSCN